SVTSTATAFRTPASAGSSRQPISRRYVPTTWASCAVRGTASIAMMPATIVSVRFIERDAEDISAEHRRPARAVARRLLERVGELQHAELVAMPADDLQADRQAPRGEAPR